MKKILVVDDVLEHREILSYALMEEERFLVIYAENGKEAFGLLEKNKIDLILSDLQMPDGDGLWLLKTLKAKAVRCPPVIILSGHPTITEAELLNAGAVAFFSKPYCMKDLMHSMKKWLG